MGILNPFMREVVEMHYLWTMPVFLDDSRSRLRRLLPKLSKTSYQDGIRTTVRAMGGRSSDTLIGHPLTPAASTR
jgi:hypothetical protein